MENRSFVLCSVVLIDAIPDERGARLANLVAIPKSSIAAIVDEDGHRNWKVYIKPECMAGLPFDFESISLSSAHYQSRDNVDSYLDDDSIQML